MITAGLLTFSAFGVFMTVMGLVLLGSNKKDNWDILASMTIGTGSLVMGAFVLYTAYAFYQGV